MGDLARVDVFVPEEQLDGARYVLLADEVGATLAPPTEWWDAGAGLSTSAPVGRGGSRSGCWWLR